MSSCKRDESALQGKAQLADAQSAHQSMLRGGGAEIYGQARVANKYLQRSGIGNYHAGWETYGQHCPLNNNRPIFPHPSMVYTCLRYVCIGMDVYLCCSRSGTTQFLIAPSPLCLCLANTREGDRTRGASVCIYRLCVTCADWCRGEYVFWSRNHFASWNSSIKWRAREMGNLNV